MKTKGYFVALALWGVVMTSWRRVRGDVVHEMHVQKAAHGNYSVACGACVARGGVLAVRPQLEDWDILFNNLTHMQSGEWWVDLVREDTGGWVWGDGVSLDLTDAASQPLVSFSANTSAPGDWTCALWDMSGPEFKPADCRQSAGLVCQVPSQLSGCINSELSGMKFDDAALQLSSLNSVPVEDLAGCHALCLTSSTCWAADWNSVSGACRPMTTSTRPAVPDLVPHPDFVTFGRTCVHYQEMSGQDCDFVCNCGAVELPEGQQEIDRFLADHKEEVKRELIVPTDTLSATTRKKESAKDERQSSTGIGYLGIGLMVLVFGGVTLLDLTSLAKHFKVKGAVSTSPTAPSVSETLSE